MTDAIGIEELRDNIRDVLTDRRGGVYPILGDDGAGFDNETWQQMTELGWLALALPEEAGGLGLGMQHLAVLYEELGRDLSAIPILPTMMATLALAEHCPGDNRIEKIATGEIRAAVALPDTHECLSVNNGTISGTVYDVAFADVANLILLPVTDANGIALAVIDTGVEGISINKRALVDLTRSAADVTLRNVPIEQLSILHPKRAGWASMLDHAAIGLASDAVGGATALFEITIEYLKTREQFGRPIGSFQALKHRAASWNTKLEAMTAMTRNAGRLRDAGDLTASAAASGAHILACETYADFAEDAVQLHGGIGFTWEHSCHLFLKRASFAKHMFGTVTSHRERVAALVFEQEAHDITHEKTVLIEEA